jgi:hypothetical protein
MGNGALPHGSSYRAHPRLYRNSPGRCGPAGLLTEVLRNRQRWAVSDNQIDRAQRTSSHVWYRHSPDTCHNEHWQCQDCHHHEFCRYEHKYPHRCPLEYSLPLMRQFENSGKAPKGFPVDTHGMLRMTTSRGHTGGMDMRSLANAVLIYINTVLQTGFYLGCVRVAVSLGRDLSVAPPCVC